MSSDKKITANRINAKKSTGPRTLRKEAWAQLGRYEGRALSRRNRAIRMFQAISIVAPFLRGGTKG